MMHACLCFLLNVESGGILEISVGRMDANLNFSCVKCKRLLNVEWWCIYESWFHSQLDDEWSMQWLRLGVTGKCILRLVLWGLNPCVLVGGKLGRNACCKFCSIEEILLFMLSIRWSEDWMHTHLDHHIGSLRIEYAYSPGSSHW
jgi:hypothetical protein